MTHIMLDLETWGVAPGSALRSIGACVFDPVTGEIGATFYRNVSDASCEDVGLTKDASTVAWWANQSAAASEALLIDPVHVIDALESFGEYWGKSRGQFVWGNGASFDPVILEAACAACFMKAPWDFWNIRCYRTVLAMANRKVVRTGGTHHNALDDAVAQAKAIAAAFRTKQFSAR